jgi:penicillin-binding protein 1A
MLLLLVVLTGVWLYGYVFRDLPSPDSLGTYLDAATRYTPTSLVDIPEALQWATVVTDDPDFYFRDSAGSFFGVFRSIWYNLDCAMSKCLRIRGATIPQRLAVNLLLVSKKDSGSLLSQNMRELALTLRIIRRYSHDEILEFYLNALSYAEQIYGPEEAARFYYGKHVRDLSLAECSMLQAIVHIPDSNTVTEWETAKARQRIILDLLVENGYINEREANIAKKEPLTFIP